MKKLLVLFFCFFLINFVFAEKVSDDIKNQLIDIYTKFTEETSVLARANYCINPDIAKMENYYNNKTNKTFGYTPKKFGVCEYYPDRDLYLLTELLEGKSIRGVVDIPRYAFFKKINGEYKLDWDAWTVYNTITLVKYEASKSEDEIEFRCYVSLTNNYFSNMKNYYAFDIRDENTNYRFTAFGDKSSVGGELFDIFEGSELRPLILKIKYDAYIDKFIITEFVQRQWSKLTK